MQFIVARRVVGPVFIILLCATVSAAQSKRVDVKFRAGASSGTYANTVTGYGTTDFYVKALAGQQFSARLTSSNRFLYFVVLKNAETVEAVSDDAREQTEWAGSLPEDGTYVVRVYLVRAEARRNKRPVRFKLDINVR